jgi:subtilisin family serine protease
MPSQTRRDVLKTLAGLASAAAAGPAITAAEEADNWYIIDVGDEVTMEDRLQVQDADVEVVHDLEHVGYLVVRGSESSVEGFDYESHNHLDVREDLSVNLTGDGEDVLHLNEDHYHGTHVAGIAAAHGGSGELILESGGGVGVAPEAEIVSMRYFSTAGFFFGNFAAAVEAAIVTDCDVINASLGFIEDLPESRTYLRDYIQNYIEELARTADEFGIVWVASAHPSSSASWASVSVIPCLRIQCMGCRSLLVR